MCYSYLVHVITISGRKHLIKWKWPPTDAPLPVRKDRIFCAMEQKGKRRLSCVLVRRLLAFPACDACQSPLRGREYPFSVFFLPLSGCVWTTRRVRHLLIYEWVDFWYIFSSHILSVPSRLCDTLIRHHCAWPTSRSTLEECHLIKAADETIPPFLSLVTPTGAQKVPIRSRRLNV